MNHALFDDVNHFARATAGLHEAILGYATYGWILFAALLAAAWWTTRRTGRPARVAAAVCAGLATPLAVAANQPIVNLVGAPRPYTAESHILVLVNRSTDYSFPSDHAVMAGAVAAGLLLVSRRLGALAAAAAVAMAFARVYIGAHYPADVAAGLVLGAAVAVATYILARGPVARLVAAAAQTRLRPLLLSGPPPAEAGTTS